MVHLFSCRASRSRVNPVMLQTRERPGRSTPSSSSNSTSTSVTQQQLVPTTTTSDIGGGGGGGGGGVGGRRGIGHKVGRLGSGGGEGGGGGSGGGGLCLLSRLGQYKRRQNEQQKRRVAEKELDTLHQRIDKLLAKMEERDVETLLDEDEECVVCLGARATMQTFPCEHRVVCRKCFIRTIQVAVAQRSLPLRCVVCRARILKLRHSASGAKAVSVGTFRSSSTPPVVSPLSQVSDGFVLNNNNNGNVANNNTNNKTHGVSSLGKVAPCCTPGGFKEGKSPPSALIPDPPRVTLVKSTTRQFSPLGKSGHVTRREASPSTLISSSTPGKSAKTSMNGGAPVTPGRPDARNKAGDVHSETAPAAGKGSNCQLPRRGRVFHFKPLFWRQ